MTRHYFGTDGIRGTVGTAPITPDFVLRLAHAVPRAVLPAPPGLHAWVRAQPPPLVS